MKVFRSVLVLIILATSGITTAQETRKLGVESNHSSILFSVPISNGITRITGTFTDYTIDIDLVDDNWAESSISATIQVASINTGIPGRDDHLRTADFFDVETYPEITFVSKRIEQLDEASFIAYGDFTMHGVTNQIEFPFTITGAASENTYGVRSRLTLNRIDYGVGADFKHSSMPNFLGEEIGVEIDFWTKKKKQKE